MKATLPKGEQASSCLLFQIGETTQVLSGGALQATPHAVRSSSQEGDRVGKESIVRSEGTFLVWEAPAAGIALSVACTMDTRGGG